MAIAKRKTKKKTKKKVKKRSVPSAARKKKVMADGIRSAMRNAMDAVKRTEEAKAQAELKVFAAKLIVHIAKEAGIKGPPASVKKKAIAEAKKKAAKARKNAEKKVDAARKKALTMQTAARKKAA
jgi:hypothetical protein